MLDMNKVDTLIRIFPAQLMTRDILNSYKQEHKDIKGLFLKFSTKVVTFTINHVLTKDAPRTGDGMEMNVDYWQAKE